MAGGMERRTSLRPGLRRAHPSRWFVAIVASTVLFGAWGAGAGWGSIPGRGGIVTPSFGTGPGNPNGSGGYSVKYVESGLSPGTEWGVRLGIFTQTTLNASLTFSGIAYGRTSFVVYSPAGYSSDPSGGSLNITANYQIEVSFSASGTSGIWPPSAFEVLLIGGIVGVGGAAIVISELLHRRGARRAPHEDP
jgi:hypothetical protein